MNNINIEIYFLSFLLCFVLFYLFVLFFKSFVCLFLFILMRYCNKGLGIVTLQFNIPKELGPVLREARG